LAVKKYFADVIIVGGGISGVISAVIAARSGCSVILLEKGSCLGGSATAGLLGEMNGVSLRGRSLIPALGKEIIEKLVARDAALYQTNIAMTANPDIRVDRVRYNSEYMKIVLDELAMKERIRVFFGCHIARASSDGVRVEILIANLYEEIQIDGRVIVDSSGNSECFYILGEKTISNSRENKQAISILFKLGGINPDEFSKLESQEIQAIIARGKRDSILPGNILSMICVPGTRDIAVNCTRCSNIDHESIEDFSSALLMLRCQIDKIVPFIRENVRGCREAYLGCIAASPGIRDRRCIEGIYELKGEDVITCRYFEDTVAVGAYPVDIHKSSPQGVEFIEIEGRGIYNIPYRSLINKTLGNVIANGKCISADDVAFGAIRVMGPIMNIATAAGAAAAAAVKQGAAVQDIDLPALQKTLESLGVHDLGTLCPN
jgi:hypothetical protein